MPFQTVHSTDCSQQADHAAVAAGQVLADGWTDVRGNTFSVSGGVLLANGGGYATNSFRRPDAEKVAAGRIVMTWTDSDNPGIVNVSQIGQLGPTFREQPNGDKYWLQLQQGGTPPMAQLYKQVGGTPTSLGSFQINTALNESLTATIDYAAPDGNGSTAFAVSIHNNTRNETYTGSFSDNDAALRSAGWPGITINPNGSDPFKVNAIATYVPTVAGASTNIPITDANFGNTTGGYANEGSTLTITTDGTGLQLGVHTDTYTNFQSMAAVGVQINGGAMATLACTAQGDNTLTVDLSNYSGTKTVVVTNGMKQLYNGNVIGTYLTAVGYVGGSTGAVVAPTNTKELLVYSTSIAGGGPLPNVPAVAWGVSLRDQWPGNVWLDAYGGRSLHDDCATTAGTTALAQHFAAEAPAVLYCDQGVNDGGLWSASDFAAAYGSLLDQFHALKPTVPVIVVTPLLTTGRESDLVSRRAAIVTMASSRPYITLGDGSTAVTAADVLTDGVHLTAVGQVKVRQFVLGLATAARVAGSSTPRVLVLQKPTS